MAIIKGDRPIEATTTLTASYVAADVVDVSKAYEVICNVTYTPKSGQSNRVCYVKVETSPDNSTYYQETTYEVSTSSITHYQSEHLFTGATGGTAYNYVISIPLAHKYFKVSTKEDGSANFGTVAINATIAEEV